MSNKDKSRAALLRLYRWQVDEHRKALGAIEARRQGLVDDRTALDGRVAAEQAAPLADPLAAFTSGGFARRVIVERQGLDEAIGAVDGELEEAREALYAAFMELKRLEILEERRLEARRRARETRAAQGLDEAALQRFARQGRGGP